MWPLLAGHFCWCALPGELYPFCFHAMLASPVDTLLAERRSRNALGNRGGRGMQFGGDPSAKCLLLRTLQGRVAGGCQQIFISCFILPVISSANDKPPKQAFYSFTHSFNTVSVSRCLYTSHSATAEVAHMEGMAPSLQGLLAEEGEH